MTDRAQARSPADAAPPRLELHDVTYSYGSLQVLFGISMVVRPGEIVGLLGTNGAGKSTLLRVAMGVAKPTGGTVHLDGQDITGTPAEQVCRLGMAMVPGGKAIFGDMTVLENLEVGAQLLDRATASARIERELDRFGLLRPLAGRLAGSLSGGEQQQLAIAKALLLDCSLLCIDELSLGLSPMAVDGLIEIVRNVNETGMAMLIVEQSLNVAAALCSRALFLEKGEVRFEGPPLELLERGDIARAIFLGASEAHAAPVGVGR